MHWLNVIEIQHQYIHLCDPAPP